MPPQKSVTLRDIGDRLGIDKSSVSLALRNSPKISSDTKQRVLDLALELGYRPNVAARQLSSTSPQVLGLVMTPSFSALSYGVAAETLKTISELSATAGILLDLLSSTDLIKAKKDPARFTVLPDGFLIWGEVPLSEYTAIAEFGRPVVVLDPHHHSYESFEGVSISVDNAGGAASVTEHFASKGVKRILFIMEDDTHLGQAKRLEGSREYWLRNNPLSTFSSCMYSELTDNHLREFCSDENSGIFCSNDITALQVWHRLQAMGFSVPEDVKLAGFDGIKSARALGLTSAMFDGETLGRAGYNILKNLISRGEETITHTVIPVTLFNGDTV